MWWFLTRATLNKLQPCSPSAAASTCSSQCEPTQHSRSSTCATMDVKCGPWQAGWQASQSCISADKYSAWSLHEQLSNTSAAASPHRQQWSAQAGKCRAAFSCQFVISMCHEGGTAHRGNVLPATCTGYPYTRQQACCADCEACNATLAIWHGSLRCNCSSLSAVELQQAGAAQDETN